VLQFLVRLADSTGDDVLQMVRRNLLEGLLGHLLGSDNELARLAADCIGRCIERHSYVAALLYSADILGRMQRFVTEGGAPDDVEVALCWTFASLCAVGRPQVEDGFFEWFICGHSDPGFFSADLFAHFCGFGIEIEEQTVKCLIEIVRRSERNDMAAALLVAVHGLIKTDARNALYFLKEIPITLQFLDWAKGGDGQTIEVLLIVIQQLFQDHHRQDSPSAAEDCVEAAVYALQNLNRITCDVHRSEAIQKHAVYALLNVVQICRDLIDGFQTEEHHQSFLEMFREATFYVRRALLQLFLAIDTHGASREPKLSMAVMEFIVEILDGYRGKALLHSLICILDYLFEKGRRARCDGLENLFVQDGGVDAILALMDDDEVSDETKDAAEKLFDRYFNEGRGDYDD
jgi:hypothetical protein